MSIEQPQSATADPAGPAATPGRKFPGPFACALIVLAVAGMIALRVWDLPPDRAGQNLATVGLSTFIGCIIVVWIVIFSGYPAFARRLVAFIVLGSLIATGAMVRFDQFTGNMIPTFRWAWAPPSDQRLGQLQLSGEKIDLAKSTPLDFPQYLGPSRDGIVDAVKLRDSWDPPPRLLWKRPIGAGWSGFVAVNGLAVTMEQRGPEELVTCYSVHTGKPVWAHALAARHETVLGGTGPRSTPTIHQGRVFALGATGVLRCLNGDTGELLWSRDLPDYFGVPQGQESLEVAWGRANSPLIVDDLVVVPAGGPAGQAVSLVAFKQADGTEAWRGGKTQISYSSPILATLQGRRQIIVVNEDTVSGHDPVNGELLWSGSWPGSSSADANTSQPHVFDNSVIVSKGYPKGGLARYTISGSTATQLYHQENVLKTKLTSIVLQPGTSFAYGLSDGILECADLEDGQRQWKGGRYGHGQLLMVGGHLLILSERGELALVRVSPEQFEELARIRVLDDKTWNTLCLFGRILLVRNSQEAAAWELPVVEN